MAINNAFRPLNNTQFASGYVSKLVGFGGAYNQFGFLDGNSRLYQNFGTDGYPIAPFGSGSPAIAYAFTQQNFGSETGKIIDAKILPEKGYALFDTGNLYTWGNNDNYNLVVGDLVDRAVPTLSATNVAKVFAPISYCWDINYSCMFIQKNDGLLYFGGYNNWGVGGLGNITSYNTWQVVSYFPANTVKSVWLVSNYASSVFIQKTDGTIHACGYNSSGILGTGDTTQRTSFVDVTTAWGGVSAGDIINVIGSNGYFEGSYSDTPVALMHRRSSSNIDTIWHCGNNSWGARGNGLSGSNYSTPAQVTTAGFPTSIYKLVGHGGSPMSISVVSNANDLWKWGYNAHGQAGVNSITSPITVPTFIKSGVSDVFGDGNNGHTFTFYNPSFIKLNTGQIQSSGYNNNGQLGVGDITQKTVFTDVRFPKNVNIIDIRFGNRQGGIYTYALSDTGQIYGTGWNAIGNLNPNSTSDLYVIPRLIPIAFNL